MANNNAVLSWNANTDPDIAGYKLYYGRAAGSYLGSVTVGLVTTTTLLAQLVQDGMWFFGISGFDTSNNESAISSAVSKRIIQVDSKLIRRR